MDTGPLHAETIEAHPQSQTCAVTGTVYTFLPKGPGPPTRTAAPHHACLQVDEHGAEWAAGRSPACWGHACCTPEGRNLHSGSPLPRDSQLTLNKALSTFESTSPSRAENNKTAHAICKRTSSSFVQGGY